MAPTPITVTVSCSIACRGTSPSCRSKRVDNPVIECLQERVRWLVGPKGIAQVRILLVSGMATLRERSTEPQSPFHPWLLFMDQLAVLMIPSSLVGGWKGL